LALLLSLTGMPALAQDDDYDAMLGFLANSRIDGNVLRASSGVSGVNLASGDFNQQANLRAFASGGTASIFSLQQQRNNRSHGPIVASATIGGGAYVDGRGLASINQASGSGNAQLNAVAAALSLQGIRETTDDTLSAVVTASAGGQHPVSNPTSDGGVRKLAVEPSAMQGFQGVMQLNQAAGSGNATGNQLLLSVSSSPQ
jgi:hypothetical protein